MRKSLSAKRRGLWLSPPSHASGAGGFKGGLSVVAITRDPKAAGIDDLDGMIETGASPRASLFLTQAAKAGAFLQGRTYATPHDVKNFALDVLRHRVVVTYEAEAQGRTSVDVIERILAGVLVP